MDIDGIGGVTSGVARPAGNTAVEKEGFLKLLVAQISNQDPLAPQDSEKFVSQLTEFSTLEQLMNLNDGVHTLALGQLSGNSQEAIRFVGREVVARGESVDLQGGLAAPFHYRISGEPSEVTVVVRDESGREVHRQSVPAGQGMQTYTWDGRGPDGQRMRDGRYSVSVEAADAEGHPLAVDTYVRGRVTGVRFDNGYPELMIGDRRVRLSEVTEVGDENGAPVPPSAGAHGGAREAM